MSNGTSWYGRGSTAIRAKDRNGPALALKPRRTASRSKRARAEVTDISGVREIEARRLDRLERQVDPCHLVVGATQRAKHQKIRPRVRQHHPLASASPDERADRECHRDVPKMLG